MNNYKIKNATAIYTGGGIYIYYGQLENGLYFRTADEWEHIAICDRDTSDEDADYPEFYEEHEIECFTDYQFEEFFNSIILWIMHNQPDGNYNASELESRLFVHIETDIEIEDAQTLAKTTRERVKREKFENMLKHQIQIISDSMAEDRNYIRFIFDDSDYYRRDFEKQWRDDFYNNAVRLFEKKGYHIERCKGYDLIKW